MELFTKLERDLVLAAQKKDRTSLDALVAAGFTERTAIDPEHPVARAEWIEKALPDYRLDPMVVLVVTQANESTLRLPPIWFENTCYGDWCQRQSHARGGSNTRSAEEISAGNCIGLLRSPIGSLLDESAARFTRGRYVTRRTQCDPLYLAPT